MSGVDLAAFFKSEFAEHHDVARRSEATLSDILENVVHACVKSIRNGGKLLFFGNGGSAADAQHLATELTIRYKRNRSAIAAIALTTDTSALTAAGNDLGFEQIFARQIEALGKPGDVAVAIFKQARAMRLVTIALSGGNGGELAPLADHLLLVPSITTARIQEMHITLGQMLCGALEIELGLATG